MPFPACAHRLSFLALLTLAFSDCASSYFVVTEPNQNTQWQNGKDNLLQWTKGVLDGIDAFDLEMARLSSDGLVFIARNVPATPDDPTSLNIHLSDIPPGDDYFLLLFNSTHGGMYATSDRFTVLSASDSLTGDHPDADGSATTVTVSGSPDPTRAWATTLAGLTDGGVLPRWTDASSHALLAALLTVLLGSVLGVGMVLS